MLEHLNGEKYGTQLDPLEKIQFPSHMNEEELGFIKVMFGRYTLFYNCYVHHIFPFQLLLICAPSASCSMLDMGRLNG